MLRKTKHQENIKLCKKINYSEDSRDRRSHSLMDSKRIQYSKHEYLLPLENWKKNRVMGRDTCNLMKVLGRRRADPCKQNVSRQVKRQQSERGSSMATESRENNLKTNQIFVLEEIYAIGNVRFSTLL